MIKRNLKDGNSSTLFWIPFYIVNTKIFSDEVFKMIKRLRKLCLEDRGVYFFKWFTQSNMLEKAAACTFLSSSS